MIATEQLNATLPNFTGSQTFYRHWTKRLLFTDGIQFVAINARAQWLIDAVASYQSEKDFRDEEFQLWILTVNQDRSAILEAWTDSPKSGRLLARQKIEYSDFPLPKFEFYVEGVGADRTMLLKSEH
jgi:hypothetical protein